MTEESKQKAIRISAEEYAKAYKLAKISKEHEQQEELDRIQCEHEKNMDDIQRRHRQKMDDIKRRHEKNMDIIRNYFENGKEKTIIKTMTGL